MIAKFTVNPARLLGLPKGVLTAGADGDVTVIDPGREWVFDREQTASQSYNSPFYGWRLKGRATATIVGGRVVWSWRHAGGHRGNLKFKFQTPKFKRQASLFGSNQAGNFMPIHP